MRLKQLKELIHNSANHFNIEKATVRVEFREIEEVEGFDQVFERGSASAGDDNDIAERVCGRLWFELRVEWSFF